MHDLSSQCENVKAHAVSQPAVAYGSSAEQHLDYCALPVSLSTCRLSQLTSSAFFSALLLPRRLSCHDRYMPVLLQTCCKIIVHHATSL